MENKAGKEQYAIEAQGIKDTIEDMKILGVPDSQIVEMQDCYRRLMELAA